MYPRVFTKEGINLWWLLPLMWLQLPSDWLNVSFYIRRNVYIYFGPRPLKALIRLCLQYIHPLCMTHNDQTLRGDRSRWVENFTWSTTLPGLVENDGDTHADVRSTCDSWPCFHIIIRPTCSSLPSSCSSGVSPPCGLGIDQQLIFPAERRKRRLNEVLFVVSLSLDFFECLLCR